MGITIRHYLFPAEGAPLRISKRLVDGLVFATDVIPHLAGTEQRVLTAIVDNEDGKPSGIIQTQGSIWHFDHEGKIREALLNGLRQAMEGYSLGLFETEDQKVVDLNPRLNRKRRDEMYRWKPANVHIEQVIADIWPKKGIPRLKDLKGIAPRPPAVPYEAQRTLREATSGFWKIQMEIDRLSEPSLKGFAFEARRLAADDDDAPLYLAVAQMAERKLEILKRRRSEKGVWVASIEIIRRHPEGHSETTHQYYQRCDGRTAAEKAARRLLVEHSDKFAVDHAVEAFAVTDIEWRELMGAQEVA